MAWKSYNCTINEKPAQVLIDQSFQEQFPLKELPRILWIGIYCNHPSDGAFWHPDETSTLDEIENDLLGLGQSFGHGWMLYVLRIATPGIREYYFYYGNHAETNKIITSLKGLHPKYQIEADAKVDSEWVEYGNYISFEPTEFP